MLPFVSITEDQDAEFILKQAGLQNKYGVSVSPAEGGVRRVTVMTSMSDFNALETAASAYETTYLSVALPAKLRAISNERDRRIKNFEFMGFVLDLEGDAKRDLADAAFGLTRAPDIAGIDWSLGEGEFTFLPREVLLSIADAAFLHIQKTFAGHRRLATAAKAATTVAELAAVNELDDAAWS
jgi:hypothetical protein